MIEWENKTNLVDEWSRGSKDGIWKLDYNGHKEKEFRYWIYNYRLTFGTFAPSEEDALPCFIKVLKEHVKAEQELIAEIESGEAK